MVECWKKLPIDKHFWAFYFFCKKKGDKIWYKKYNNTADLYLIKKGNL